MLKAVFTHSGLTEINKVSINYKPVSCKAEKKNSFPPQLSLLIWEKKNGMKLYESKSILSSHLKVFPFCECFKNNCHRTSKILTLFILDVVKRNTFRNKPQGSKIDFWFIWYSFESLIEWGSNWLLEAL